MTQPPDDPRQRSPFGRGRRPFPDDDFFPHLHHRRRHHHHEHHEHDDHPPFPPWGRRGRRWRQRQRSLFWRFAAAFGGMVLFVVLGMALLALIFTRMLGGSGQAAFLTLVGALILFIGLPLAGFTFAVRASRNLTAPLADVMAAADAIATGDLSVRVPETSRSEFGQLARTFNRMVSELQRSDEQRRNLTADVAHELRTPLHIIQGNLEGILDGVYQPTPDHIHLLLEETQLLARLVEDLRTLSQAESGHLPLHKERVGVADLLTDLVTSFQGQAESAGIALRVDTERLGDTTIEADVLRLNQVLANLITNAFRYTPSGGSITLRGEPTRGGVRLTVSDTGQGISADDLPHVFDRFWRGDPARTHKEGAGGGLGLAIVKQLVELHQGQVSVQSVVGAGTTFSIDLPSAADQSVR